MSDVSPHASSTPDATPAEKHPQERTHFKQLLLANHFKQVKMAPGTGGPMGNTTYEELVCVGYEPKLRRLDAVVHVKQESGYSGDICTAGSQEYVKFFASTDDGATWSELGTSSFTAWDVVGKHPLEFDVSLVVDLDEKCCNRENLVLIRAILSWQVPPGAANDPIVWGNSLDVHVQVAPKEIGTIFEMLECLKLPVDVVDGIVDVEQVIEFGAAKEMSPLELHKKYQDSKVPQHRYMLAHVDKLLASPLALNAIVKQAEADVFPGLQGIVDIESIVKVVLDPQGDQTFEQIGCVGLNTNSSELVATIDVKLPSGYSGDLCWAGSNENVAFWVDWGAGWNYVGTTAVRVHDIASIPADGLRYSAALPFADALTQRQPCGLGAKMARIRAVLSWGALPSNVNPYAVPVWGGHLETNVLIPPGQPVVAGGPVLESIGSMPVAAINAVTGLADGPSIPGFVADDSPFGGSINFGGWVVNPAGQFGGPGIQYRVLLSTNNGATSTPMTTPFTVRTMNVSTGTQSAPITQTPDVDGWCNYLADTNTPGSLVTVVGNILGYWTTSGDGGLWISMEARQGAAALGSPTPWQLIQLDNTRPTAAVTITSGGGSCGDFHPGDLITGEYSASDNEALSGVSISVQMPMPGTTMTKTPVTVTPTFESGQWSLQTLATTTPCGYVIDAVASDRTIVNSGSVGWHTHAFTGFCMRP
jgi:DNA uptake protein ComE-like DNA-binding protein